MPVRFKVAIAAILVAAFFVGYAGWNLLTRIDSSTTDASRIGSQNQLIIRELQAAEKQRQCAGAAQGATFAVILDLLADNFATPPYPDVERQRAVQGLRKTAELFRHAPAVTCPK